MRRRLVLCSAMLVAVLAVIVVTSAIVHGGTAEMFCDFTSTHGCQDGAAGGSSSNSCIWWGDQGLCDEGYSSYCNGSASVLLVCHAGSSSSYCEETGDVLCGKIVHYRCHQVDEPGLGIVCEPDLSTSDGTDEDCYVKECKLHQGG